MRALSQKIPLGLDTLLLLLMMLPHLWFNPVSSAIMVIGIAVSIGLDLAFGQAGATKWTYLIRFSIVLLAIMVAVLLPTGLNMLARAESGPATYAHDGLIQTEEAIKFLLAGRNPYTESYVNTPMADFPGTEPPFTDAPLYHLAYLPFLFLVSVPIYVVTHALTGWYDQRLVYLFAFFLTLLLLAGMIREKRLRLAMLSAVGLNYLFAFFLADGRNDVMVLAGLVAVTFLLDRGHVRASALGLGLTLALKHSAWFFLPFYIGYLWPGGPFLPAARELVKRIWPLALAGLAMVLPFLMWDAASFVDDTVLYIGGSGPGSFPIKGWGFSNLLLAFGLIDHAEAAFPFVLFELAVGLPVLWLLWRRQRADNTLGRMWLSFAVLSFAIQFFSRFFSDNYAVFIVQALVIALFLSMAAETEPEISQETFS